VLAALVVVAAVWLWRKSHLPSARAEPSVAVLPFSDETRDGSYQFLADGLSRDLSRMLSAVPGVRVVAYTAALPHRTQLADVQRIGDNLSVQAVVQGSLKVDGSQVRIVVQLINTQDGFQAWNATYDRDLQSLAPLRKEMAQEIAVTLHADGEAARRAIAHQPNANSTAYVNYLRGWHLVRTEPNAVQSAIEFYRAGLRLDSGYALAWAGLADALTVLASLGEARPTEVLPQAAEAARKAVELNPSLAESQRALARVRIFYERDWKGAEEAIRRAIQLDPSLVEARYDHARLVLSPTGRFADAADELRAAIAQDPTDDDLRSELANCFIMGRRYDAALQYLEEARGMNAGAPANWVMLGVASTGKGNYEEALKHFEQAANLNRSSFVLGHIGYTLAKLSKRREAAKIIDELERLPKGKAAPDYDVAAVHTALGEQDYALAELERARDSLSPSMLWVNVDYRFDDLRRNSRFSRLLTSMGLN
jgi:serine/threonine-protein kinase